MLTVENISVGYGPVRAVRELSLELKPGQLGTVVGANGAGKSSLLKAVSGLVPVRSGTITFDGERIEATPAHRRTELGIAHVLEGHRVFGDQSVEANLVLGALRRYRSRRARAEVRADVSAQYERFPILGERRAQLAATLSGGEQQMLATSVALMSRPRLLLLDEPSLGLAPKLVEETFRLITALREEGLTVLLVEQRASLALRIADYGWVLRRGELVAAGPPSELTEGAQLDQAYLGAAT
ncbi:ABC transporter ATP-binding protein [Pseudonocardia acaciae]|uniref:ABC transporter ATP-binding protein n=1 Tax=Pseudonocardia acaciae TaxID=551276 RepID=UPI00048F6835|nr:ABC transporter ATP-binding protein [Pseudonocardia acaciae]